MWSYTDCSGGSVEALDGRKGFALGIAADAAYVTGRLSIARGEMIYLYTDGVTEATNQGEELFGEPRLEAVLRTVAQQSSANVLKSVAAAIGGFVAAAPQADDITAMAVRWSGDRRARPLTWLTQDGAASASFETSGACHPCDELRNP